MRQIDSPIGAAYEVLEYRARKRDLLDLAQAAPRYPAAPEVIEHIGTVARQPHYFNHDMWLRMNGIRPVYLEPGPTCCRP
ncbi:hypothetical protein [Actinoplanes subtropicus]|uniref:hypothetical protein n=1 Tax=Actinoplanes subtropicus TaxID=543632 RepID=UPI000A4B08D6|nr:hypothetical protein [Actinoplanes subtropicus]